MGVHSVSLDIMYQNSLLGPVHKIRKMEPLIITIVKSTCSNEKDLMFIVSQAWDKEKDLSFPQESNL